MERQEASRPGCNDMQVPCLLPCLAAAACCACNLYMESEEETVCKAQIRSRWCVVEC